METLLKRKLMVLVVLFGLFSSGFPQQYNESNDFSYALKLYNEGFYDIAAQQFATFINRYPASEQLGEARYYNADSYYKINNIEKARMEFQAMAVSFPDHQRAPQAWYMVGECYQKQGKPEEAAKAFETVKILYPTNPISPKSLLEAGESYLAVGQLLKAEQVTREFLDRYLESSEFPQGRILYGKILLQKGELEKARREFQKVEEITSDQGLVTEAKLGQAAIYQQLGLLNRATAILGEVSANRSASDAAYEAVLRLSTIYQDTRQYDLGVDLLRKALTQYSTGDRQNELKMRQARMLFLKQDYIAAGKLLEELADNSNEASFSFTVRFYRACCELEEHQSGKAASQFEALLKEIEEKKAYSEFQSAILYNLSSLYLGKGNFSQARRFLNQYQALNPKDPNGEILHQKLIEMAFDQNMISAGMDELQRFRGTYPASPRRDELIYRAGKAFLKDKQYERSLIAFEQIVNEYVCSATYDSSKIYLDFINTFHQRGQQTSVSGLAKLMGQMLSGKERNQLLYELGQVYLQDLKEYEEAASVFQQYIETAGTNAAKARGLYYLSESNLRLAQYQAFRGAPNQAYRERSLQSLKEAMEYLNDVPHPDTLTYWFLSESVTPETADPERRLKYWQHFVENYPNSKLIPEVKLRLSEAALAANNTSSALKYVDEIIAARQDHLNTGRAYWLKAKILADTDNYPQAIQTLKDFLLEFTDHPYQAKAYWQLSQYYAQLGDYETGAKFLERMLELFDYSDFAEEAPAEITDYFIRNGEYSRALTYLQPQLESYSNPDDPVVRSYLASPPPIYYYYAGSAYYQQDDFVQARQNLLTYLNRSQDQHGQNQALMLMGRMAAAEQDYDTALLHFSLVKQDNKHPEIFYQANEFAADIFFREERYDEASARYDLCASLASEADEKIYHEAQKLRCLINLNNTKMFNSQVSSFRNTYKNHTQLPTYLASFEYDRGKLAFENKQYDPAIGFFKNILKRYKNTDYADDAQYYIGRCYAMLNRSKDALKEFDTFLKTYPRSELLANVYLTIAEIHFRNEESEAGLEAVKKAVDTAGDTDIQRSALSMLIRTYQNLGLYDGALHRTRQYIDQFPNADDVIDKKIAVGIYMTRLNRNMEAVEYLQKLKFEVSSDQEPEIQFYIGESYYNAGQYENAIREFLKVPLLSKKTKLQWEASALYLSGQSYEKMGRRDDAIRMYTEIINRPGIQTELKREARRLIDNLQKLN